MTTPQAQSQSWLAESNKRAAHEARYAQFAVVATFIVVLLAQVLGH